LIPRQNGALSVLGIEEDTLARTGLLGDVHWNVRIKQTCYIIVLVQVGCEGGGKGRNLSDLTCKLQQQEVAHAFTPPSPPLVYV